MKLLKVRFFVDSPVAFHSIGFNVRWEGGLQPMRDPFFLAEEGELFTGYGADKYDYQVNDFSERIYVAKALKRPPIQKPVSGKKYVVSITFEYTGAGKIMVTERTALFYIESGEGHTLLKTSSNDVEIKLPDEEMVVVFGIEWEEVN